MTKKMPLPKLFLKELTERVMVKNLNANILVEGDYTGVGKSYISMRLCEDFHDKHKKKLDPFTVDNIFFEPEDYIRFAINAKRFTCGMYDDAGATAGNRNWFDEVITILGTTSQTYRFRNLIMFITVPFGIELDIDLRRLCHYDIVVHDRGYAKVYKTTFKKFANKGRGAIFSKHIFDLGDYTNKNLKVPMPSKHIWQPYEEKKSKTFMAKYEEDLQTIITKKREKEWSRLRSRTDDEIMKDIIDNDSIYRNNLGDIDLDLIQYHSKIGYDRGRRIKNLLREIHSVE